MPRKPSKPKGQKKRNEFIHATTMPDATHVRVKVNALTGEITFGSEMVNVYSEINYDRPKGPKVLSRVPQSNPRISFDPSPALAKNFDFLCAVDTNTKTINGHVISVVGVVIIRPQTVALNDGLQTEWRCEVPFCLEYVGLRAAKPENFGWLAALDALVKEGFVGAAPRIGVIVDSDLGNISCYNQRKLPVDSGEYLPVNVQLIYATADSGKESAMNWALGIADSAASQVFAALEGGQLTLNPNIVENLMFERMRSIAIDVHEGR